MPSRKPFCCDRCHKGFSSTWAKQQHESDSLNHHICRLCSWRPDYETKEELDEHLQEDHNICTVCNRQFSKPQDLIQHDVAKHNMCATCHRYFRNPSDLRKHKVALSSRDVNCPGCSRRFHYNSALVLHLKAGTCGHIQRLISTK